MYVVLLVVAKQLIPRPRNAPAERSGNGVRVRRINLHI